MLLYIIRHGDPDYANDCLTPLGKRQAEAVGRRLTVHGLDKIFASPMGRARQTAQPACEMLHLPCGIEEWVSEDLAYKDMSVPREAGGRTWIFRSHEEYELKSEQNLRLGVDDWADSEPFAARDMNAAIARIRTGSDAFLASLGYERVGTAVYRASKANSDRVAVFCHEGAGMTWISLLLGIPAHIMWTSFSLPHSSVSIFDFGEREGLTTAHNIVLGDVSHIYAERLPMRYDSILL